MLVKTGSYMAIMDLKKSSIAQADGQKRSDHAVMVFDREFIKNSFENYINLNKMRS